jgi:hypothetical protein
MTSRQCENEVVADGSAQKPPSAGDFVDPIQQVVRAVAKKY